MGAYQCAEHSAAVEQIEGMEGSRPGGKANPTVPRKEVV